MQKPIIYGNNLEITYNLGKTNEFKALKGVNVGVIAREYIILFGPSGCGKSTLLYSMFGVLKPSAGNVYVKGDSIYDYSPMEMVHFQRKTMGIMYQQFNLIPSITVLDNVALPLIFAGVPSHKREKKAWELLERFGIDEVAHKRPSLLSGGQQQRVSVARSLVNDPEILIADEPVGNLDSISAEAVMDTLEQINEQDKKTVLLVTHDAKYLPYAHRIFYMKDGFLDRVVTNPEKSQVKKINPGETIVTEIEQIQRIYPYDTPGQLRVKSIINYLTQNLSFDQITRLEKLTEDVIDGRMSGEMFFKILTTQYDQGGAGIDVLAASDMAGKIKKIIDQSRDISRYRKMRKKTSVGTMHHEFVRRIRKYVLEECQIKLDKTLKNRLDIMVGNRIAGFSKKEDFKAQLLLPVEENGLGLEKTIMHRVTRYLEKLVAQGVHADSDEEGSH